MFGDRNHAVIYQIGLMGLAASLPLSVFTTSLFIIILASNWVLEGRFSRKLRLIRDRKSLWFVFSVYLIFILALIFTQDFSYAFHDLKIKLPLLVLPLIIGTTSPLRMKQLRWVLFVLILGVIAGSLASSCTGGVTAGFGRRGGSPRDAAVVSFPGAR